MLITVYMERDAAEWLLARIQAANNHITPPKNAVDAEAALIAGLGQSSKPHNPHKDFGSHYTHAQGEPDGLPAATDAEAVESIK